jgi:hypothetical protein
VESPTPPHGGGELLALLCGERSGATAAGGLRHISEAENEIDRETVRNLINPYSTASARWWCRSGRYTFRPEMRKAAGDLGSRQVPA